ncbi:MAG: major capsid protein [Thermodesulfobacteriota bacterium]
MATLDTTSQLTLIELANRLDPRGNTAVVAEVLTRTNAILKDAPWVEANDVFSHKYTRRLTLPTGSWRQINAGVAKETSRTVPVTEVMGFLESYSEVDKKLVENAPNQAQFRMTEAKAFIEGMSQTLAAALVYANAATDPEKITGLAPRLDGLSQDNVLGAGGTGATLTSIYIVQWGEDKVHLFYPKGSRTMGVVHKDLGEVTLQDALGNNYQGFRDHFEVNVGLAVRDERCIARYGNITTASTAADFDEDHLIELMNRMPQDGEGAAIYCNRYVKTRMEIKLKDKSNVNFTTREGLGGVPVLLFRGCPVRKVDAILNTETQVS